ncbi:hypothetical protein THASP1DRAFT_21932 [Thamnocephalis sphaerospora]|uniref:Uncharacterized protein n=1 Tax=Thamnocephalis sphaerospora TaxID=78915 RepID=A0A4P9XWD6_9FUNG|nr:hypothetical protein THASP1DRAFT_21932 [Thamnocephalis sphaerospora]|eukprot:RKP10352.1 hypothetical protein THASP1DRAFT_21932 [Thamnocephalis sphaerospora]
MAGVLIGRPRNAVIVRLPFIASQASVGGSSSSSSSGRQGKGCDDPGPPSESQGAVVAMRASARAQMYARVYTHDQPRSCCGKPNWSRASSRTERGKRLRRARTHTRTPHPHCLGATIAQSEAGRGRVMPAVTCLRRRTRSVQRQSACGGAGGDENKSAAAASHKRASFTECETSVSPSKANAAETGRGSSDRTCSIRPGAHWPDRQQQGDEDRLTNADAQEDQWPPSMLTRRLIGHCDGVQRQTQVATSATPRHDDSGPDSTIAAEQQHPLRNMARHGIWAHRWAQQALQDDRHWVRMAAAGGGKHHCFGPMLKAILMRYADLPAHAAKRGRTIAFRVLTVAIQRCRTETLEVDDSSSSGKRQRTYSKQDSDREVRKQMAARRDGIGGVLKASTVGRTMPEEDECGKGLATVQSPYGRAASPKWACMLVSAKGLDRLLRNKQTHVDRHIHTEMRSTNICQLGKSTVRVRIGRRDGNSAFKSIHHWTGYATRCSHVPTWADTEARHQPASDSRGPPMEEVYIRMHAARAGPMRFADEKKIMRRRRASRRARGITLMRKLPHWAS